MDIIIQTLEIIYLISAGPVIAYFIYRGLEQIKVSEETRDLQLRRQSYKTGAEQGRIFNEVILNQAMELRKELMNEDIDIFDNFDLEVDYEKKIYTVKQKEGTRVTKEQVEKLNQKIDLFNLLNSLESFAATIVNGVASEKVVYTATSRDFVHLVKRYAPWILVFLEKGHYKNLMSLFHIWYHKIEREKLEMKKSKIEQNLEQIHTIEVNHIGAER